MPQFDPSVFAPQIVWLALVFALLYLVVARSLPKVERAVEDRRARIAADLAAAERARAEANAAATGRTAELGDARAAAQKLLSEARARADAAVRARLAEAEAALGARTSEAEAALSRARAEAIAALDEVAAEAAAEMVGKVAGLEVSVEEARAAVRKVAA
ncbi:ATPase [Thermaurantiacus tibetensis]|uniref:F0F1 ATP synthase subunit B family protein n=1 Tax=Thermaurantiacus tibetensis TaxID=2759035 RepID=UPI00188E892A|nr:ATPase [Thermaurantiacus tibetensis]